MFSFWKSYFVLYSVIPLRSVMLKHLEKRYGGLNEPLNKSFMSRSKHKYTNNNNKKLTRKGVSKKQDRVKA